MGEAGAGAGKRSRLIKLDWMNIDESKVLRGVSSVKRVGRVPTWILRSTTLRGLIRRAVNC